jgi:hypothetical protein
VINRRFQGLAKKIRKTHQTVLAKRIQLRVRSGKDLGGLYVWKWNFRRGLSAVFFKTQELIYSLQDLQGRN